MDNPRIESLVSFDRPEPIIPRTPPVQGADNHDFTSHLHRIPDLHAGRSQRAAMLMRAMNLVAGNLPAMVQNSMNGMHISTPADTEHTLRPGMNCNGCRSIDLTLRLPQPANCG
jgi:hypothetical protein